MFTKLTQEVYRGLEAVYRELDPQIGCVMRLFCCDTDLKHIREAIAAMQEEEGRFCRDNQGSDSCFRQVCIPRSVWEMNPSAERNTQQLEKIRKFIREHMEEPITRTQIAEALYLSPGYVSHIIKEVEGCSCKEMITEIKMEYARKLLRGSRLSIGDIAMKCGYDSFAYFSKVYKSTFGITPSMEREGAE